MTQRLNEQIGEVLRCSMLFGNGHNATADAIYRLAAIFLDDCPEIAQNVEDAVFEVQAGRAQLVEPPLRFEKTPP